MSGRKDTLRVNFDRKLKFDFHGTKVTSNVAKVSGIIVALEGPVDMGNVR